MREALTAAIAQRRRYDQRYAFINENPDDPEIQLLGERTARSYHKLVDLVQALAAEVETDPDTVWALVSTCAAPPPAPANTIIASSGEAACAAPGLGETHA